MIPFLTGLEVSDFFNGIQSVSTCPLQRLRVLRSGPGPSNPYEPRPAALMKVAWEGVFRVLKIKEGLPAIPPITLTAFLDSGLNAGYYHTNGIPTGNPHVLNIRPTYFYKGIVMPVIILKQRKGLSRDQKRRIVQEFTETMVNVAGVKKDLVTIMIEEKEPEDIGKGGKLRCDE